MGALTIKVPSLKDAKHLDRALTVQLHAIALAGGNWPVLPLGPDKRPLIDLTEGKGLTVLPSEVVNALRWSLTSDPGVGSVMIVMVQPGVIGFSPGRFTVVGSGVGPFLGQGSVKPFDFPVGLGAIGASEPMFHARPQRGIEQA